MTGQCRRWWWLVVRGHRGGRVAFSGIAGDRAAGAGGGTGSRRPRRHHVEQSFGILVATEGTGRDIGVDTGECVRIRVCMCVGAFASISQWARAIGRSGSAIAPVIAYHVATVVLCYDSVVIAC